MSKDWRQAVRSRLEVEQALLVANAEIALEGLRLKKESKLSMKARN